MMLLDIVSLVQTIFKLEGDRKLIQDQKCDKPSTIIRELPDDNTLVAVSIPIFLLKIFEEIANKILSIVD